MTLICIILVEGKGTIQIQGFSPLCISTQVTLMRLGDVIKRNLNYFNVIFAYYTYM